MHIVSLSSKNEMRKNAQMGKGKQTKPPHGYTSVDFSGAMIFGAFPDNFNFCLLKKQHILTLLIDSRFALSVVIKSSYFQLLHARHFVNHVLVKEV